MRSFAASVVLALAFAGLAIGCGGSENPGSQRIKTNAGSASAMAGHKTYAYEATAPAPPGDAQWAGAPLLIAEVKEHIDTNMKAKGYVLSADKPEMVIRISVGVHKSVEEPRGSTATAGAPSTPETVTDLAIDVFDRENNGHLFHGTASNQLHHDEPGDNKVAKAVRLILEPVPAAAPSTVPAGS